MSYAQALDKAWNEISNLTEERKFSIKLLADTYDVNVEKRRVFSSSSNILTKDYLSILILHYLIQKLKQKVLPEPTGEWIGFKQLEGGDGYYPTFKKRTIDVLLEKYGSKPETLLDLTDRLSAKRIQIGDFGVVFETFEKAPILITAWKGDEEFSPEVNIHFDKNISKIFCTEDIVVLTEFITHSL